MHAERCPSCPSFEPSHGDAPPPLTTSSLRNHNACNPRPPRAVAARHAASQHSSSRHPPLTSMPNSWKDANQKDTVRRSASDGTSRGRGGALAPLPLQRPSPCQPQQPDRPAAVPAYGLPCPCLSPRTPVMIKCTRVSCRVALACAATCHLPPYVPGRESPVSPPRVR